MRDLIGEWMPTALQIAFATVVIVCVTILTAVEVVAGSDAVTLMVLVMGYVFGVGTGAATQSAKRARTRLDDVGDRSGDGP